jgi:cysteine-rich repeat protein
MLELNSIRFPNRGIAFALLTAVLYVAGSAPAAAQECETIDFNNFQHGDAVTSLSLFGGSLSLTLDALRNDPAGAVDPTAYDTERWDNAGNPPPNSSHNDTQRAILCNPAQNGGIGECDGIVLMVPDVLFERDGDDSQGGFITLSGFDGLFEIPSYAAVDSDNTTRDVILRVGPGLIQVGTSTGQGNGTVETVVTDPQSFSVKAEFEFEGSGGIDDIMICRVPICGDGTVDPPDETCDDGNDIDDDECRNDCTFCGDGEKDQSEECDDGNDINDDTCRNDCTLPICGDGVIDPGETCDDGNDINDDECRNNCSSCGDGMLDAGEECDDGNNVDGDGCDAFCTDEPMGGQGCTPGYWKQSHHFESWVGFDPSDDYETVFGVDASFELTLLGALKQGGGGEKALGRQAVAALLSASSDGVSYFDTVAGIISRVQAAYASGDFEIVKDLLDEENNAGCPLD